MSHLNNINILEEANCIIDELYQRLKTAPDHTMKDGLLRKIKQFKTANLGYLYFLVKDWKNKREKGGENEEY